MAFILPQILIHSTDQFSFYPRRGRVSFNSRVVHPFHVTNLSPGLICLSHSYFLHSMDSKLGSLLQWPFLRAVVGWHFLMIPIRPERVHDNADEPEAIRNLKKKAIYKLLAETWMLPEENSKGVHRRYLVAVYRAEVLRIHAMEFKRFEVELTPAQLKKTPFISSGDVFAKIGRLLTEMGQPPLGFEVGLFPEDTWLYKVVRFIDRANATGVYLQPAPPRAQPGMEPVSNQMIRAKRHAETYLVGNIINQPVVFNSLKTLWDSHKKEISRMREVEQLERELAAARAKLIHERPLVQSSLARAALVVFTAGTGNQADAIFIQGEAANHARLQMTEITDL